LSPGNPNPYFVIPSASRRIWIVGAPASRVTFAAHCPTSIFSVPDAVQRACAHDKFIESSLACATVPRDTSASIIDHRKAAGASASAAILIECSAMPDAYSQITKLEPAMLGRLISALETRAADPRQEAMRNTYLSWMTLPEGARVLEVGCGTGVVSRDLARRPGIGEVTGLDPSPVFLAKARELAPGIPNLRFEEGDAHNLHYDDQSFDMVLFHTCLTHVPTPERALAEAFRVLRCDGYLAIFDGDYASQSVAIGDHDPLQDCIDAATSAFVHDPWLVRRISRLAKSAGFQIERFDSHGYVQTTAPDYMLTLVDRGADALAGARRIDPSLVDALKLAARQRAANGDFFGSIMFASLIARKPVEAIGVTMPPWPGANEAFHVEGFWESTVDPS
jgi:ubiquinone/menaquinone biosynthesis C-methylase UbiE